jgi:hypothetical protein
MFSLYLVHKNAQKNIIKNQQIKNILLKISILLMGLIKNKMSTSHTEDQKGDMNIMLQERLHITDTDNLFSKILPKKPLVKGCHSSDKTAKL